METTWSECVGSEGPRISVEDIANLSKGDKVHILGRMRTRRAIDDMTDRSYTEIVISSLEILHTEMMLLMQM